VLLIRWRPSRGRGEYEYISRAVNVLGKSISVRVPGTETIVQTDVRFDFKDGKPRLRRGAPNDRSILNLPPLVAAIAALPQPKRSDESGELILPLREGEYVVSEIGLEIVDQTTTSVVLEPIYLRPLHGDVIDIEVRLRTLRERMDDVVEVREFFHELEQARNSTVISELATRLHERLPAVDVEEFVPAQAVVEDEIIEDYVGQEGKETIRLHRRKERDRKLVKIAKRLFRRRYGALFCECCSMDFERTYGQLGRDYIEAHHRVPLSQLIGHTETTPDDLAMLCADCHRMVHRTHDCSIDDVVLALLSTGAVTPSSSLCAIRITAAQG
jgi:hypothetical protein